MRDDERLVSRVVGADDMSRLYTASHSILALPSPITKVGAVAVMPGLGEHARVMGAIEAWQSHPNLERLMVCGTNKTEKHQPQLTLEVLAGDPFNLERVNNVDTQVEALHTREQTDWLVSKLVGNKVTSLVIFVSHWHMHRAYRTLLKSMLDAQYVIPVFPRTVWSPPSQIVPELNESVQTMSAGEVPRIMKYQAIGQIARDDELMDYLNWMARDHAELVASTS